MSDKKNHDDLDYETTGHEWDGIKEYNKPLPKWWLYTFYACIVWAIGYSIAYPSWPGIKAATPGLLGFSTRVNVAKAIEAHEAELAPINAKLAAADLGAIADDQELLTYANNAGAAVFLTWCAQCHGSGAAGAKGYPNLLDDDWLWGGDIENIATTVNHGIRNETDPDARYSQMPAFGDILPKAEIAAVVEHVVSLSSDDYDRALAESGSTVFADNCAACHGDGAEGNREMGAPDLTDAIWLYGGDRDTLTATVRDARFGVMPAWGQRLSDADVRAVSVYVHSLGGGE